MKAKYILLTCLFFVAFSSFGKKRQLIILHTNDTHSCILPIPADIGDTLFADRGGYIRRSTMIAEQRKSNPNLLLFDSGDFSQGSPFYTMFKGDVEIELMNIMKYDAATIGNHEFDFGLDNMARVFKKASFPIVCSNYDVTGTVLGDCVKPYIIIKRGGLKIGVMGLSPQLEGLVFKINYKGITYKDPGIVALQMATFLKEKKKCDVVICLSHLGWDIGGQDDQYMISHSRNIDLVLGGHSHSYLKKLEYVKNIDGKPVPVDQNGKNAVFVGKLTIDYSK
ncbi:MAG TPA: metallophosphatase [Thomasclavelia ramosa]|nr:metallophosphatase [Thomasclavelia ramosa]